MNCGRIWGVMEQKEYLFVGGNQDGQVIALPSRQPEMRFPLMKQNQLAYAAAVYPPRFSESDEVIYECYYLERLAAKEIYYIYRHESLTMDEVLVKLLSGYKPE